MSCKFYVIQDELAIKFNINYENLPAFVSYFPQTEQYSVFMETFTKDKLADFLDKFIKWETPLKRLKYSEMKFRDVNCTEVLVTENRTNTESTK